MNKILCLLLCVFTLNCKANINLYDIDLHNSSILYDFNIDKNYIEYCFENNILCFNEPKTIWSYLFIDRQLRFKLQLNPACWFWDFSNSTVPVNYWCFKISINF
jgi:hypothetical protein